MTKWWTQNSTRYQFAKSDKKKTQICVDKGKLGGVRVKQRLKYELVVCLVILIVGMDEEGKWMQKSKMEATMERDHASAVYSRQNCNSSL